MGWVLYENYPLDQDPHGSSTLLTLPNESFAGVDAVALMFSWQDIEKRPDEYDFSKVDFAYDYWAKLGKEIQLRLSTSPLLWWGNRIPPAGKGVPDYVLAKLAPAEKQTRELQGVSYVVVDARNPFYRERLSKFLRAVNTHFAAARPVTLIDLRGFGAWGEWHSGFRYPTLEERRTALKGIIDIWSGSLSNHPLALSYSYDPDGPKALHAGSTEKFDARSTGHYADYLKYSAFDYALTKDNITFRRDGCGGAVHSNERKLNEEAFRLGRRPMFSEFLGGFSQSKVGGAKWIERQIANALSLHPNYISLLGWQGADALAFLQERTDSVNSALARMGYRLVPTRIAYPTAIAAGRPFDIEMRWVNRGVGRALRDYELRLYILASDGHAVATTSGGTLETSRWVAGNEYVVHRNVTFWKAPTGGYEIALALYDGKSHREIELPIAHRGPAGPYQIGDIKCLSSNRPPRGGTDTICSEDFAK